ncbi:hypothetical protein FOXYSP1_10214 [Fusarium oxysporum f. sp. phaseoli]
MARTMSATSSFKSMESLASEMS